MNKLFSIIFILISFSILSAAETNHAVAASLELHPMVKKIQKHEKGRELIAKVQAEGPISIIVESPSEQFDAYWNRDDRQISVNISGRTEGEIIGSIIFELHNALVSDEMERLDNLAARGAIDRSSYVRSIEYLEYENSHKASSLVKEGIEQGIYPKSAHLFTYRDFDEHFHYQKVGGHTDWIAKNYDSLKQEGLYMLSGIRSFN